MEDILHFLKELKENNNREWFNANKDWYQRVRGSAENLCIRLIEEISKVDKDAERLQIRDCMYRIYRDTRFSADKTPYKTHIGIFVNPPYGKKSLTCGYYLHIEPGNCFFCAGTIGLPSKTVTAIRQSIYDEIDEYREIVENDEFKRCFPVLGEDFLKTVPKGFSKDWEYIDYVRPRNFVAYGGLTDKEMCNPKLIENLRPAIRQAKRFNDFMNYTIIECEENRENE